MTKVRWGIVSTGNIAGTFARDIAHASNACLIAVAARHQQSADEFAEIHKIERAYEGYGKLFADADVDAVYVATPHTLHLPNSADALKAGKPVLCEKPITTSADECRELLDVAASSDSYLMEAMWSWFLPAMIKAKAWFDEGRIGKLQHLTAELGYPKLYDSEARVYNRSLAGGCLLDMGIYPIAIARYFTNRSPVEIHVTARHAPNGVDDDVAMLFDYGDYAAALATSFRCKLPNVAYIIGTEGYIAIPDCWRATECHLYVLDERIDTFVDDRAGSGFEFQISSVSKDIIAGRKESRVVPHSASLAFQEDMDRVRAKF